MQDSFQFFSPSSVGLRSLVTNLFYIRSSDPAYLQEQMVLPYPQLTLGFFLKSHFEVSKSRQDQTLVQKYVFSRISKDKVMIRPLTDEIEIIGANLKPFALRAFTARRADQLDWYEDPKVIFQQDADEILKQLKAPIELEKKVELLEQFITRSIINLPDSLMVKAFEIIHQPSAADTNSVGSLAESLKINDRTLRNHFKKEIGISPVAYLQLLRVHQAVHDMKKPLKNQADIYFDNNYFDQAHFIHEFKKIADMSPARFQKQIEAFRYLQF
jgi:AraC-like DNA-binding protein